jgi:hypothetical protein
MSKSQHPDRGDGRNGMNRRTLFAGASTVGALAAVATVLPRVTSEPETAVTRPAPTRGGGYSLSEHVKHYYRTTRI